VTVEFRFSEPLGTLTMTMIARFRRILSRAQSAHRSAFAATQEGGTLLRAAISSWLGDRASSMGAAIAYYAVFSLAPVLILIIAVAGLVFGKRAAEGALFDEIAGLVGNESAGAVQAMLRSASETNSGIVATIVGLGALIVAATAVFGEVQAAFNVIWKAKQARTGGVQNLVKARLRSLALIVAIGFLLLLSLGLSAALAAFSAYLDQFLPGLPTILQVLNFVLSFGFTTVLFAMMFKILPDASVEWWDVWVGAAITSLLFTIGKYFISLYIGSNGVRSIYHAAGAIVLILIWIYYSAQILLFGAELSKAFGDHRAAKRAQPVPPDLGHAT
jgi:membrane protein